MATTRKTAGLRLVGVTAAVLAVISSSCGGQPGERRTQTLAYVVAGMYEGEADPECAANSCVVALVDDDGTNHRRLANLRYVSFLGWSPDGTRLATSSVTPPSYIIDADGSGSRRVSVAEWADPQWAPDGGAILFDEGRLGITVVSSKGLVKRRLGPGFDPAWSPDGESIAFVRHERGTLTRYGLSRVDGSALFVVRRDGSGLRELAQTGGELEPSFGPPVWSPDGRSIAFVATRYSEFPSAYGAGLDSLGSALYVVDRDSAGVRKIARSEPTDFGDPGEFGTPVWLPDGKTLLVQQDVGLMGENHPILRRIAVDGSRDSVLARVMSNTYFGVNRDGDKLAYIAPDRKLEIVDLKDGSRTKVKGDYSDSVMLASPDGDKLAYIAPDRKLEIVDLIDGSRTEVNGDSWGSVVWAPDGDKLAYIARDRKLATASGALHVINADGTNDRRVSTPKEVVISFDWRPSIAAG